MVQTDPPLVKPVSAVFRFAGLNTDRRTTTDEITHVAAIEDTLEAERR